MIYGMNAEIDSPTGLAKADDIPAEPLAASTKPLKVLIVHASVDQATALPPTPLLMRSRS